MKSTTQTYKNIIASGAARKYAIKIDLTLANNTVLHLTGQDIWEDSFSIDTASSGTSTFDIGSAVIGKCTFTINNIDGDFDGYDFFNASAVVWLGLVGDTVSSTQQYHRMGFFTVDEPQKANGLISLTLLDYMWKFDVPFSGVNITYPATALTIVQTLCTYCGVQLAATSATFHGYNFSIAEEPKDADNMNCREMLQYIAMIGCNFCRMSDQGQLEFKWYDSTALNTFDYNQNTSFGTDSITITGVKFVINKTDYTIGSAGYVLELENPLVTEDNVSSVLNLIWDVLDGFTLRTYTCTTASDLAAEIGDRVKIKDYQGNYVYSWITLNSFKLAAHQIQCNAQAQNRTLVKRYSKSVQAAVDIARQQTNEIISNYDLAVQMMNDIAVNSMGGYEEYEDLTTGGRIWYLSNRPITKSSSGTCSFESGSTVYKKTGDGFFVSRDGGQTWTNGYNTQTGELVVNVLDAIGINFDWARGGTLTLGGYGNGNGELSIQNASNVEKVHGDNTGISAGSNGTRESKLKLNINGELEYYYEGTYAGKIRMSSYNEGTEQSPVYVDYLGIEDFNRITVGDYSNSAVTVLTGKPLLSGSQDARIYVQNEVDLYEAQTCVGNDYADYGLIGIEVNGYHNSTQKTSTIFVCGNGHTYLNTRIHPNIYLVDSQGIPVETADEGITVVTDGNDVYSLSFENGMLYRKAYMGHKTEHYDTWHTWSSGGNTYDSIVLSAGVTAAEFPSIDTTATYEPYIQVASGASAVKISDIKITGTTLRVEFPAITSAQAAGNACIIKLCKRDIV